MTTMLLQHCKLKTLLQLHILALHVLLVAAAVAFAATQPAQ